MICGFLMELIFSSPFTKRSLILDRYFQGSDYVFNMIIFKSRFVSGKGGRLGVSIFKVFKTINVKAQSKMNS